MEVTKKATLLECLDIMRRLRNSFSHKGWGMVPIDRYHEFFEEYSRKCEIIEEMIHALDSEPVRRALANWQKELMEDERRHQEENGRDYPEERDVPAEPHIVFDRTEMDRQPVLRMVDPE